MTLTPRLQAIADRMETDTWFMCRSCGEEYLEGSMGDVICLNCEESRKIEDAIFDKIPVAYQKAKLEDFRQEVENWALEFYNDHLVSRSEMEPITDKQLARHPQIYQKYVEADPLARPWGMTKGEL